MAVTHFSHSNFIFPSVGCYWKDFFFTHLYNTCVCMNDNKWAPVIRTLLLLDPAFFPLPHTLLLTQVSLSTNSSISRAAKFALFLPFVKNGTKSECDSSSSLSTLISAPIYVHKYNKQEALSVTSSNLIWGRNVARLWISSMCTC